MRFFMNGFSLLLKLSRDGTRINRKFDQSSREIDRNLWIDRRRGEWILFTSNLGCKRIILDKVLVFVRREKKEKQNIPAFNPITMMGCR